MSVCGSVACAPGESSCYCPSSLTGVKRQSELDMNRISLIAIGVVLGGGVAFAQAKKPFTAAEMQALLGKGWWSTLTDLEGGKHFTGASPRSRRQAPPALTVAGHGRSRCRASAAQGRPALPDAGAGRARGSLRDLARTESKEEAVVQVGGRNQHQPLAQPRLAEAIIGSLQPTGHGDGLSVLICVRAFGGTDGVRQRKIRRRAQARPQRHGALVTHQEAKTEARKRRRLAARHLERKLRSAGGAGASGHAAVATERRHAR